MPLNTFFFFSPKQAVAQKDLQRDLLNCAAWLSRTLSSWWLVAASLPLPEASFNTMHN